MFWRGSPINGKQASGLPAWPRNGAILKGKVHEIKMSVEGCNEWLEVSSYKQAGSSEWVTLPENTWLQFQQGGKILFPSETA